MLDYSQIDAARQPSLGEHAMRNVPDEEAAVGNGGSGSVEAGDLVSPRNSRATVRG
jgi:hypothetical protein